MPRPPPAPPASTHIPRPLATAGLLALCSSPPAAAVVAAQDAPGPTPFSEVAFRQISTPEGLPSATVYSLLEDDDGWLWVGTAAGLYRYDGVDFVGYGSRVARQPDVHDLRRGPDGRLFCQNFRGQLFAVDADSLRLVGDFGGRHAQFTSYAFVGGDLAVATDAGVLRYPSDPSGWPLDPDAPAGVVAAAANALIHGVGERGAVFTPSEREPPSSFGALAGALPEGRAPGYAPMSARRQGDSCWVAYHAKLGGAAALEVRLVGPGGRGRLAARLPLPAYFTNRGKLYVQGLPDGRLAVAGTRGLLVVEPAGPGGPAEPRAVANVLPGASASALLVDRDGHLWIGTADRGLLFVPDLDMRREDYPGVHAPIVDLAPAGSGLLATTFDGTVYALGDRTRRLASYASNSTLYRGRGDTVYLGHARVYPSPPRDLGRAIQMDIGHVKAAAVLADGSLALATSGDAKLIFPHGDPRPVERSAGFSCAAGTNAAQTELHRPRHAFLRLRRATGLALDSARGRLYVAYNDALVGYDLSGATAPEAIGEDATGGRARRVFVVDGRLLVTRAAGGLAAVDAPALAPALVVDDLTAAGDYVWLETTSGVYRARRDRYPYAFERFGVRFGLPAEPPTAFAVDGDYAYAAYGRRVARVPADATARATRAQAMVLAAAERAGERVPDPGAQPLPVEAGREPLRLKPRLPDYSRVPETRFEYRLAGPGQPPGDTAWRTVGPEADVLLNALPAGRHVLSVRMVGAPATATAWVIDARVPFWRKPLPYVLLTVALAAAAVAWVRRRARRRQGLVEREAALRESQLSALAAQMNPHFVFNALNSVQDFIMDNDRLAASDYLTRFARLIRLTLEHSRRPEIALAEELDVMDTFLALERVRFDGEIEIALACAPDLELDARLPALLVQPYVENAFKHGLLHRRGERRLRVAYEGAGPRRLRVTVEDNGVGRARAAELGRHSRLGATFSTGATARRLRLLNEATPGAYDVLTEDLARDGVATGTRVTLTIRLLAPDPPASPASAAGIPDRSRL